MNPYKSLEDTIKDSDLPSLSKDYLEIAIDGVLDDGILKDIPLQDYEVLFPNPLQ